MKEQYEGWIAAEPIRGGVRVVITGPQGFERAALFALDEDPAVLTQRVRETIPNDSIVGCLRDSTTDKMRGAVSRGKGSCHPPLVATLTYPGSTVARAELMMANRPASRHRRSACGTVRCRTANFWQHDHPFFLAFTE